MFTRIDAILTAHRRLLLPTMLALAGPGNALAQQGGFADDFSTDSVSYSSFRFDDSVGESSASGIAGGIALMASSDGSGEANRFLRVSQRTESMEVEMRYEEASTNLPAGAYADFRVEGNLFNVIADGGPDNGESREGDIFIGVSVGLDGDGNSYSSVCLSRNSVDGNDPYPIFDEGNENCSYFEDIDVVAGQTYTLGYALDMTAATLRAYVNDEEILINLPETPYSAHSSFLGVNMVQGNGPATATATISRITTDNGSDDFSDGPTIVDRYYDLSRQHELYRRVYVADGQARLEVQSGRFPDQDDDNVELATQTPSDHIEAVVTLEPDTDISEYGMRAFAALQAILYNDIADGGTDGRTGDVRAELEMVADANGMRRVEYCLRRYDDAEGDSRTNLLPDDRSCIAVPITFALGDSIRMAITLDREAATVTFRVGGEAIIVPVANAIFTAANRWSRVYVESRNGARTVVSVDDLRTATNALTEEETAAGLATPPAFPEPAEPAVADSSINYPVEQYAPVTFTDDFSSNTALFGVDIWPRESDAGIALVDGALELQVHAVSADQSSSAGFEIQDMTDFLHVTASISEQTALTPGDNEASFDMEAVFHNDTVDGGLENREGDLQAKIRLRIKGTGEWRVNAELRRRNADGDLESLEDLYGEDYYHIFELTPEFDEPVDLGIELNRETRSIRFLADEQTFDVALPTELFVPAQTRRSIRAWHGNGDSGRAVVRVHSIETEAVNLDFTEDHPVIAPYRPSWDALSQGRSVTVEDGRLVLRVDGDIAGGDPRIVLQGRSDYLGADLELSSESELTTGDGGYVDISGLFYNDFAAEQEPENDEGNVFAVVRLVTTVQGDTHAEACAFRSKDANFDSADELLGGDTENCPRFNIATAFDTSYPASIELDRDAATLTFTFADEQMVYNIPTAVHEIRTTYNGARAQASEGSSIVAYVDNLAFASTTNLLAESPEQILGVPVQPETRRSGGGQTGRWMLLLLLFQLGMVVAMRRKNGRLLTQ